MRLWHNMSTLRSGRVGRYFLLWMIGIPLPIILILYFVRGCG